MYNMFLDGSNNVEKTFELFKGYAVEAQINYNQHLRPEKMLNYLKIIKDKQSAKYCRDFYAYILTIHGKYIQMMSIFFIMNDTPDQIEPLFTRFNEDFQSLDYGYKKIMQSDLQFIRPALYSEDEVKQNQDAWDLCEASSKESFEEKMQKIRTLVPDSEKEPGLKRFGLGIDLGTTYCCACLALLE